MTTKEFNEAIEELRVLRKSYKSVHPSNKDRLYKQYLSKLNKLSAETHMDIEDITINIE